MSEDQRLKRALCLRAALMLGITLISDVSEAACLECSCSVETSNLSFGNYNPRRPSVGSAATIRVTCDGDSGYLLKISAGSSGTPLNRTMHSGASVLVYNLFKDPSRAEIWGDGSGGASPVVGGGSQTYTVYGTIYAQQSPSVGLYTDNLVISVEY